MCSQDQASQIMCMNINFVLTGFDWQSMNISLIPVIFGHLPAGASTKQVIHYAQEINSGTVLLSRIRL